MLFIRETWVPVDRWIRNGWLRSKSIETVMVTTPASHPQQRTHFSLKSKHYRQFHRSKHYRQFHRCQHLMSGPNQQRKRKVLALFLELFWSFLCIG
uniref:Uncharacterized protein n=1 Tax=Arundo donax TaxID=35708 RepID=A0A0A9HKJ3_ARUDO